jgi:hypothetical protein
MTITKPLIGTDIEFFVEDIISKLIKTAEPYAKGTKNEPYNFDPNDKWACISLDNVLFEITSTPSDNESEFLNSINKGKDYVKSLLPENLGLTYLPSARLLDEELQSTCAKTFGCEGTFNAWLREMNPSPSSTDKNLRSSGFHLHFSYGNDVDTPIDEAIVKACDLLLGVPSVLIEPKNNRRELYGKAGECRFKPYGVEYRVLSGYFAKDDKLIKWVFNQAMSVIDFINKQGVEVLDNQQQTIIDCINNYDDVAALNLINQFNIQMP